MQLAKYYYKPHIEEIKQRLNDARELGNASAEEWIKGLDGEGKERLQEAARWEQWEARGGLRKVNLRPQSKATAIPGLVKGPNVGKLKDEELRNGDTKTENFRSDAIKSDAHSNLSTPQGMRASTWFSRDSGSPLSSTIAQPPYHTSTASGNLIAPIYMYTDKPYY